jgi:hypothetical protein
MISYKRVCKITGIANSTPFRIFHWLPMGAIFATSGYQYATTSGYHFKNKNKTDYQIEHKKTCFIRVR